MVNPIEIEKNLILNEYSADYEEAKPANLKVYLSITPEIHYEVQVNFEKYPEKPEITLPSDLHDDIGDPNRFLLGLREWDSHNPTHVVEIIRELEEILQKVIYPNDEMEAVMMEQVAYMSGPYKLHVSLYSYKMKTYEFEIIHKKPNPPSIILSPELEKVIKTNELRTLPKWPMFSLIDICRELSKKIDHRTRILDELKQLEKEGEYQKNIRKWDAQGLILGVRIEIETGEFCDLEIHLTEEFPVAPPNIELRLINPNEVKEDLNELLLSLYNQWQHATTLIELLDDIRNFLKQKSKNICQICHQYRCPSCNKPISQTKIKGISGENECLQQCRSCNANFHRCCWADNIKYTRKCPICLTQQSVFK